LWTPTYVNVAGLIKAVVFPNQKQPKKPNWGSRDTVVSASDL